MAKCKKCAAKSGVYGFEDAPYMEIGAAVATAYAAGKVDEMVTKDPTTGAAKDNYLAKNPTVKNALYLLGGIALTGFMPGELYRGVGIGLATYGGYNLIEGFMKPAAANGINGLTFVPPSNIAAVNGNHRLRHLPGNYGVAPSIIAGDDFEDDLEYAEKYDNAMHTPIAGLTRAL